jgi:hypothetical protein
MADLHKFQDDVRSDEGRAKPIGARHLDDNFGTVRLKLSANLSGFLKITENFPKPDELEFVTAPPSNGSQYAPVFVNGQFSQWMKISACP